LTALGKQHFGGVVALFYSPSVQKHVINLPGGEQFLRDPLEVIEEKIRTGVVDYTTTSSSSSTTTSIPVSLTKALSQAGNNEVFHKREMRAYSTIASAEKQKKNKDVIIPIIQTSVPNQTESQYEYEFGNILFGGACNQRCPFCIGHQLDPLLSPDNLRKWPLDNLDTFITKIRDTNTKKLIFTGTRTDPQLYKYEAKLLAYMREQLPGIHVALHTNGMLAMRKLNVFNQYDTVTISVNSFDPVIYEKMHGTKHIPDIQDILKHAKIPVKLSCVLTEDNIGSVEQYLEMAAKLGVKRLALRRLFNNEHHWSLFTERNPIKFFCGNPVFNIHGMEVTHWIFEKTTGKSLNLFSNGHISEEYMLAKAPGNVRSPTSAFKNSL
jgi:MoaA/NifB/PqqE/SkfB family radical SAM enzyme